MFSNLKMSVIDPEWGVSIFQISLKFKKSLKYPIGGGGQAYFGKKSKNFQFFNYEISPKLYFAELSLCPIILFYLYF